jgi:glycosyltransferase involved in cell wall biosynthesis
MSYIKEHQLQNIISLQGNENFETVKSAYQNSHFVVLPSESEGWPKVIAEGMFWGCVPISSSVSCTPYMLNYGERGVLLTMDLEKDVRQIQTLLSNATDFDKKRIEASNWSRKYTLDFFEKEILEILNSK